jgi:lipopolysaccharide heptosyltransferase II
MTPNGASANPLEKQDPREIKRIVVRTPTWVGDAVMSLPALHELRRIFPTAHTTLVSYPGTADIFIESDFTDEVLVAERGAFSVIKNARAWRRHRFDLAVLFQNAFAAAVIAWLARVPLRVGYDTDRRGALLTNAIPQPVWKNERHESLYYLNIIAELERGLFGAASIADTETHFNLPVSDKRKEAARRIVVEAGAHPGKPLAVICPGSVNSRAKRWPAERYAELTDRLAESGMDVGLIGSSAEIDVSTEVSYRARHQPIVLTGRTTVAEAVAIISIADVLISNDTGPAHIGAAVGTPTLVVFGPTNPLTTYPLSPAAAIIRHPPDCAPCMLRDCPIDHRCMTAIAPEEVFARVVALMTTQTVQVSG